jgi:hypothetical protein
MATNDAIVDLLKRHVLWDDEPVTRVRDWPDGVAVTTQYRHFIAATTAQAEWLAGAEEWVDDVVVATRDDLVMTGQRERFAFLLLADGNEIYLNDKEAIGRLGRRLASGMDPAGYAEILVQLHPYSSAHRELLTTPDHLRRRYRQQDLPIAKPPSVREEPDGLRLTFTSSSQYRRPGGWPLLDLHEWSVHIPTDGPVSWVSEVIGTGLRLDPSLSRT